MTETTQKLFLSEQKAKELFKVVEERGLIIPGKTEKQLSDVDRFVKHESNRRSTFFVWVKLKAGCKCLS